MNETRAAVFNLTQQLFGLAHRRTWFGRSGRHQLAVKFLQQVSELNKIEALPSIAAHLFSASPEVRAAANRAVHQILSNSGANEFLHLTEIIGWSWGWYVSKEWDNLSPKKLETLVCVESARASVLGLASFHRNGYIRHEAVKQLAKLEDGSELPYLLIRQNDWVDQISTDARAAVDRRLHEAYLPHFLRWLALCLHLLTLSRRDHGAVVRRMVELLVRPEHDESLADAILSSSRTARREVVRQALLLDGEHQARIVMHGQRSEDPIVRLQCCRATSNCYADDELKAALDGFETDSFMPVRRAALEIRAEAFPRESHHVWRSALLDSSSSIRELARFHAAKTAGFDAASFYRDTVNRVPDSLPAFEGLAESGEESDLPVIRRQLENRLARWRRAAIRGLASIGGIGLEKELVECLRDDGPSVVAAVRHQLEKLGARNSNSRLLEIATFDQREHVREAAVRLIFETGKWESLPSLIKLSAHSSRRTAEVAQQFVERWFSPPLVNRVWTKPSDSDRMALQRAWIGSQDSMPEAFRARLQSWLAAI